MKTKLLYTFIFCVLLSIAFTAQAQEPGTVSVKLNSATLRGQTLSLDLNINIDHIRVSSHSSLALTLALKKGNNIVHLSPIVVHGSNKFKMFERAVTLKGLDVALNGAYEVLKSDPDQAQVVYYKRAITYRPWMNKCQLILIGEVLDYNNNPVDSFTDTLERSLSIRRSR